MIRHLAAATILALAGTGVATAAHAVPIDPNYTPKVVRTWHAPTPKHMVPCKYEDGSGKQKLPCYWDAKKRGNHKGDSFWIDTRHRVHYTATVRVARTWNPNPCQVWPRPSYCPPR